MANEIKIYTKTGDDGTTGLIGGSRVKKYDQRLEAYGTIDELNAVIGVLRSSELPPDVVEILNKIQNKLFNIGSQLASDDTGAAFTANLAITNENIKNLEDAIDEYQSQLPELTHFIIPGGNLSSAQCHVARTVCRRAERRILEFAEHSKVQPEIVIYINRLSDFFFVLSRKLAYDNNIEEISWKKD
ncbi:MAG TPA: cob(I)yrinic acid a,c-diamide adenosyltransferase [Draconibacterium sp.]|nr:cob(I)yrinic acid a,c-diamide adenosyltransferase [Draconibacterium sp.]